MEELDALREQTEALGRLPALRPPAGDWEALKARMVSEGLVDGRPGLATRLATTPGWMKVAAAVLLFLGGTFTGTVATGSPLGSALAGSPVVGIPAVQADAPVATVEEAAQRVRILERQYMDALVQLRQLEGAREAPGSTLDPESRLAALEYMARAGQAALREAPADPFLNGMLATTMAEREAVLRRIASTDDGRWF